MLKQSKRTPKILSISATFLSIAAIILAGILLDHYHAAADTAQDELARLDGQMTIGYDNYYLSQNRRDLARTVMLLIAVNRDEMPLAVHDSYFRGVMNDLEMALVHRTWALDQDPKSHPLYPTWSEALKSARSDDPSGTASLMAVLDQLSEEFFNRMSDTATRQNELRDSARNASFTQRFIMMLAVSIQALALIIILAKDDLLPGTQKAH